MLLLWAALSVFHSLPLVPALQKRLKRTSFACCTQIGDVASRITLYATAPGDVIGVIENYQTIHCHGQIN